MFESLKDWCTSSVSIQRTTGLKPSGDPLFADPVLCDCYRVDQMQLIVDKTGKEVLSGTQIYFDTGVDVISTDMIILPDDAKPREIKKIGGYRDGNTGEVSITIVYL